MTSFALLLLLLLLMSILCLLLSNVSALCVYYRLFARCSYMKLVCVPDSLYLCMSSCALLTMDSPKSACDLFKVPAPLPPLT